MSRHRHDGHGPGWAVLVSQGVAAWVRAWERWVPPLPSRSPADPRVITPTPQPISQVVEVLVAMLVGKQFQGALP